MSFNFATVNQSDNPLTKNLYTEEFANVVKTPKNNFREAVDMEKYHTEMYNLQLENAKENRRKVEEDATKRVADYNKMSQKLKERYDKFLEKHKKDGWEGLENHWYWKHYFQNLDKQGYSQIDNQLDNMKEDRFYPIEMNKDGYYKIGEFEENTNESNNFVENPFLYVNLSNEYVYNYADDKLYPNKQEQLQEQSKKQNEIDSAFELKQKELNKENKEVESEEFTAVDPQLAQIYQKTLSPSEYKPSTPKRNLLFNYIYCVIFILFLFLVFKSS